MGQALTGKCVKTSKTLKLDIVKAQFFLT